MSIRLAVPGDIPRILEIYGPYVENTAYSFEYTVPTPETFACRFAQITRQFPFLVWEENGRVLGYAYGSAPFERAAFSWCAEVSVYLDPDARGRGIGSALYRVLEYILSLQGYARVYAVVESENSPSVAFHRALGYRQIAEFPGCGFKLGGWHGITWLEKALNPVELPSNFPTSARLIVNNDRKLQVFLDILSLP